MKGLNKVILIGNMVRDADVRTGATGTKAVSFTIACSRTWKDKSGAKQEATDFLRCVAFGSTGDVVANYTAKGSRLAVDGEIREEKYKSKTGENKSSWVIHVSNVVLLDKRQESEVAPQIAKAEAIEDDFNLDFESAPELGQVQIPF